ncbi:uncharacterized protein LOC134530981 isoform X3 [Bacillus rossius redtenbacheri]|uniref:uncharacterized protein LOC134530981 isoform X3 n=2 Tax=Bacillus rossius redtenbacheri TaxID=93214 RepID=UPI002FDCF667
MIKMVSKYKRRTSRLSWNEEAMLQAIKAVKENKMGWLKASQVFKVPRTTLRRRALKKTKVYGVLSKDLGRCAAPPIDDLDNESVHIKDEPLSRNSECESEWCDSSQYLEKDLLPTEIESRLVGRKAMNSQKMLSQQYCLRWKYHHNNLQVMFSQLLERESFCDVTLACEGKTLRAHKVVLSACSTYFDAIFSQYEEKNPIVILKDVKFADIKALVEFMYRGEINVDHSHLASLLRTAEDLRIKGLAEVSWRSDNHTDNGVEHRLESMGNGSDFESPPNKRRKPQMMDSNMDGFNPQVASISGADGSGEMFLHNNVTSNVDGEVSGWGEPEHDVVPSNQGADVKSPMVSTILQQPTLQQAASASAKAHTAETSNEFAETKPSPAVSEGISPHIAEQYRDVIKLNDYLTTGRRPQFWEEPFTKRVMEAIKSKELEMKTGAELLGVSYGTLYGRYRDAYGCLKHPYRVRDFWSESGPADVLAKVQRKELTLFRAAEMLNVTVTTLANYLSTLRRAGSSSGDEAMEELRCADESYGELPARTMPRKLSALENNPDITIVKQEATRPDSSHEDDMPLSPITMNNNVDHSDSNVQDNHD